MLTTLTAVLLPFVKPAWCAVGASAGTWLGPAGPSAGAVVSGGLGYLSDRALAWTLSAREANL